MMNYQGTTAQGINLAATADTKDLHSPSDGKPHASGHGIKKSVLDTLLKADMKFYRTVSRHLADNLAQMKMPSFLMEDLVQEAWLSAVQHRDRFDPLTEEELKRQLPGLLGKIVHDKAVDLLRHLCCCPCQSLDAEGIEPLDNAETQRAEKAETRAQLVALVERLQREDPQGHWLVCEHHLKKRTIRELAGERGWTENQVRCCLYRAMEKLRFWASESSPLDETAS